MTAGAKSHGEYTVGWICALPKEQTAAMAMLDQIHPDIDKPPSDHNAYTLGSIGEHNIVIACLPKGKIGTNSAATVATRMVDTFPSIKVGLMVGIGGGIPPNVRLGDVVVSAPVDEYPGVVQWDLGKAEKDGKFKRTGTLNNPPSALLTALSKLESNHEMSESKIPQYLDEVEKKWPKLALKYTSSQSLKDSLSILEYGESQNRRDVRVHYGLIASGNQVIKDSEFRDDLNRSFGGNILCVEMEAAGLINDFPCIVIRGICDYADSQKNKDWQEYAAMIAAGCAKELLGYVRPTDIHAERPVRDMLHNIKTNIENIESKLEKKEDLAILDWLSSIDFAPQQSDFINRRQQGTGQWLLDSAEYQSWLSTPSQTLLCTGIPGAGKTILSSIVINNLMARAANDPTIAVAYIYCNFKREDQQNINDLLRNLLKQLLRKRSVLPDFVKTLHEQGSTNGMPPSLDDISRTLELVLTLYSRVFIVIDALDECQTSDNCRSILLSQISKLQASTGASFFVTSRHIPDIEQHFKGCITQEILASDDDVRKYLDGHMPNLPRFVVENPMLRESIKDQIVQAAEGMFLLAHLYFDSLKDKTSKREINDTLKEFQKRQNRKPGSNHRRELLDHAYDEAMERINSQIGGMRRLGRKVIAWITCAKRPLRTLELQHGLAVEAGDTDIDQDNIREIEMIRSVCAGLVIVDEESEVVRLVHYTAQEYFDERQENLFQVEKASLLRACVTYLSFNTFKRGLYPHDAKAKAASQMMMGPKSGVSPIFWKREITPSHGVPGYGFGIHIAALFGLEEAVMELIKRGQDPNISDSYGRTALACAADGGHYTVVKLLLATEGVNPDSRGKCRASGYSKTRGGGWEGMYPYSERLFVDEWYSERCVGTPLLYAARNGEVEIVRILLEDPRVDPNARDHIFGVTPLWYASAAGHENVVKLLLGKPSVDPDSRDDQGDCMSPLSIASWRGHKSVVKLLLATEGVDPDSYDGCEQTPLGRAAWKGHEEIVDLLLEDERVNPNAKDARDFTPIILAAMEGHEGIVKLLLSKGGDIDLNATDDLDRLSPLQWAAKNGKENMVRTLLTYERVDVNQVSVFEEYTALMFAAERGHEKVVKLLLSRERVDPNFGKPTPLHIAATRGYKAVALALLANNAVEPNPKDYSGNTPLMECVARGNNEMVETFLQFDAVDPNTENVRNQTPLMLATKRKRKAIVSMLLDRGARPDHEDDLGRTPLFFLVTTEPNGLLERFIMDERVELDSRDCFGSTPLSIAVRSGHEKSAALLLATGRVDVKTRDNFGRTPLMWAVKKGYLHISNLLLDHAERKGLSISDIISDINPDGCYFKPRYGYYMRDYCTVCLLVIQRDELFCVCRVCHHGDFDICFYCYNTGARCLNSKHELELFNNTPTPTPTPPLTPSTENGSEYF
ncbi:ankyrin repeat protein [Annulohypoxylon moriforme]|nr:ankyrin repeat protein [Annulohypoxylon moriforme]